MLIAAGQFCVHMQFFVLFIDFTLSKWVYQYILLFFPSSNTVCSYVLYSHRYVDLSPLSTHNCRRNCTFINTITMLKYQRCFIPLGTEKNTVRLLPGVLAMISNIVTKQVNSISLLSANCQGLRNPDKKFDVITYYKESKASIVCLQDTHLTNNDISVIKRI